MSPDVAIRVTDLSKTYRIGPRQARYRTLRETVVDVGAAPVRFVRSIVRSRKSAPTASPASTTLLALDRVSLEVARGEVVGIIGRNGAGKSTLLKVLSRITEPTSGCADLKGRVGTLLEVGTGFHPELTGRENIYLNGAILGMRRGEIDRRFDEIVAFSEIDKFIDTPVKHYSTGMYVRLAFAVAAHLDTEILFVDEVLAVGDYSFQKKCLSRMGQVAEKGRTVVFVSHNMTAIRSLCQRVFVLDQGKLAFAGEASRAIHRYTTGLTEVKSSAHTGRAAALLGCRVNDEIEGTVQADRPFTVSCKCEVNQTLTGFRLFCLIQAPSGEYVTAAKAEDASVRSLGTPGSYDVRAAFPPLWLKPGAYSVQFKLLALSADTRNSRYLSDPVLMDVVSDHPPVMTVGLLSPSVRWDAIPSI